MLSESEAKAEARQIGLAVLAWYAHARAPSVKWFEGRALKVYVRAANRLLPPEEGIQKTLDVANVQVAEPLQGRGVFKAFLETLEAEWVSIFAENVLEERLQGFFEGRRYRRVGDLSPPSFVRSIEMLREDFAESRFEGEKATVIMEHELGLPPGSIG